MSKKEIFESLLREHGITEYWCEKTFDPNDDFPDGMMVIPGNNWSLACKLGDMYNDYEEVHWIFVVIAVDKDSKYFDAAISGLERRCVSANV